MNFTGTGKRLEPDDIDEAAAILGCAPAAVRAVLEIESAGKGFGPDHRPIILFEPHIFYTRLGPGDRRARAVAAGVAYPRWGMQRYPPRQSERYIQLAKAALIHEETALESASWGLGQLMGFNYAHCGYLNARVMVEGMKRSEGEQLRAMATFIKSRKLHLHLQSLNWEAFARGYNGASYAKHGYHTKLAAAYAKWSRPVAVESPVMAKRHLTEAEILSVLHDTARDYPEAWRVAHKEGDPRRYDYIILAGRRLWDLSGGTVGLNWRRAVVGDLSMDGLSVEHPSTGRYYFEDVISGAGGSNPSIVYRHPYHNEGHLLLDSSGRYAPHGMVNPYGVPGAYPALRTVGHYGPQPTPQPQPNPQPQPQPQPKPKPPYAGDHEAMKFGDVYAADVAEAGQTLNPGSFIWAFRVFYDHYVGEMPLQDAVAKHRAGWRQVLGLRP